RPNSAASAANPSPTSALRSTTVIPEPRRLSRFLSWRGGRGNVRSDDATIGAHGGSSSVGRAPGCGPGGRGFESPLPPFARMNRWLRELQHLDPVRDAQRIVFIDASLEFPWDTQRSLELAFYRTYAVPSIAELLDATGELTRRPQRRYDDTQLLISAFCE